MSDEEKLDKKEAVKELLLPVFGFIIAHLKYYGLTTKEIINKCKEGCDVVDNFNKNKMIEAGNIINEETKRALEKVHNTQ